MDFHSLAPIVDGLTWPACLIHVAPEASYRVVHLNRAFESAPSLERRAVVGGLLEEIFSPHEARELRVCLQEALASGRPVHYTFALAPAAIYKAAFVPVLGGSSGAFILGVLEDLSERLRMAEELSEIERRFESSFRHAAIGMALVGLDTRIFQANRSLCDLLGYAESELQGMSIREITHPDDRQADVAAMASLMEGRIPAYQREKRYLHKDGRTVWGLLSVSVVSDSRGKPSHVIKQIQDLSALKASEETIVRMASFDPVTELPNRALFLDRLNQALASCRRTRRRMALLFLDLDRLKQVNDTLGHEVGDRVIQEVGRRLVGVLREGDTVARFGGDAFTMLLAEIGHADEALHVAQRIREALGKPIAVEGHELYVTASVGITVYPQDGPDASTLMRNADAAMYRAKQQRDCIVQYTPPINARSGEALILESSLHRALEREEFLLHYQPQVDLASGRIIGAEALIRWMHPEMGLISPAKFIPLAEETGLIVAMTEWALRSALRQLKAWHDVGLSLERVGVNLSGRHFHRRDMAERLAAIISESGVLPGQVDLELTESILMDDNEAVVRNIRMLTELGVCFSLDDFGTGYSSLSYLKRFPIHTLKIDQSFVRDATVCLDDAAIVSAIVAMARTMGLETVAEGVETEAQVEFLQAQGCSTIQGYFFSRPLAPQALTQMLASDRRLSVRRAARLGEGAGSGKRHAGTTFD